MIGISIFVLFLFIAIVYAVSHRATLATTPKHGVIAILIVVSGVIAAFAQPYAVQKIDVAHVGLKVNLIGDERGMSNFQYKTGWVPYNVYTEEVVEIPSSQQHVEYKPVAVFTKGGFSAQIAPSFNYEIVPDHAGDMYVSLRRPLEEIRDTWLYTAAIGAMNDVVNRWSVDDIFNKREAFEGEVMAEVNKRVGKWFTLSQIRTNITPPQALADAINGKTRAIQEAQQMEANNRTIQMKNLNRIMEARGDSAEKVIRAKGTAEAMRIQKEEITALYVEYLKVQGWDGKNPTTLVTDGSSTTVMVK
jgi:regulator of protease activity HflC (stomatin/prohibitin superfamily)